MGIAFQFKGSLSAGVHIQAQLGLKGIKGIMFWWRIRTIFWPA